MEATYEILLGDDPVGTTSITKKGLYYEIVCVCNLSGHVPFRIEMRTSDAHIDLGLCYRKGEKIGLKTRVSVKQVGSAPFRFVAVPHKEYIERSFIPIRPEEPFAYIKRLENAYLTYRNKVPGICFKDPEQGQQGSDQTP